MKIVIYTRVSTHEQAAEGLSLDAQEEQCRGYAKSQRMTGNVEVVVEKGVSGSIPVADRPMGGAMLERLKKGDVLIAAKLDRLFRSTMDAPTVVEDLKRRGVQLHLIDLGGAVSNGVGELFLTIVAAFARAERDRIAERVRDTGRHMVTEGLYPGGRKPFGYDVKTDKDGSKRLVRNREEAADPDEGIEGRRGEHAQDRPAIRSAASNCRANPAENRPMNQGGPLFFCPQSGPALSSASSRRPDFRPPAATKRRASGALFFLRPETVAAATHLTS